jgi:hypothetical protein
MEIEYQIKPRANRADRHGLDITLSERGTSRTLRSLLWGDKEVTFQKPVCPGCGSRECHYDCPDILRLRAACQDLADTAALDMSAFLVEVSKRVSRHVIPLPSYRRIAVSKSLLRLSAMVIDEIGDWYIRRFLIGISDKKDTN